MFDKHVDGPRQGHPPNEGWACTSLPPNAGAYHLPGTVLALVHSHGTKIPLITDEYRRPIHPEIEEYMRRHVSDEQDWEQVDDEDCWGVDYTEPTSQIWENIKAILSIYLPSGPLSMDGAQWHLLKHTLRNDGPNHLATSLQNELTRQLKLDKEKHHRSFSWKLLRT